MSIVQNNSSQALQCEDFHTWWRSMYFIRCDSTDCEYSHIIHSSAAQS